jgi:hypothetical protein
MPLKKWRQHLRTCKERVKWTQLVLKPDAEIPIPGAAERLLTEDGGWGSDALEDGGAITW